MGDSGAVGMFPYGIGGGGTRGVKLAVSDVGDSSAVFTVIDGAALTELKREGTEPLRGVCPFWVVPVPFTFGKGYEPALD